MSISIDESHELLSKKSSLLLEDLGPFVSTKILSIKAFDRYCEQNPELILEQATDGKIIIMSPLHLDSGGYEADIIENLTVYNRLKKSGKVYSSSTGFRLPDGSLRSPDAAWVSNENLSKLPKKERKKFAKIVPEFVVEIRSDIDSLTALKKKMQTSWIANGVQLAWLIDPLKRKLYIYRQDGSISVVEGFDEILSGENVLDDFEFDLSILDS